MVYLGYSLFVYNGSGKVHNLNEILGINFVADEKYTDVYESYISLLCMKKSAHIGSVKSQKIDNLYKYFSQADIAPIKDDFLHKQKALSRCYTVEPQDTTYVYERPQSGDISREMLEKIEQEKNETREALSQKDADAQRNQNTVESPVSKQIRPKEKRPIVAVIMFILMLICVLGFVGAKNLDDTGTMAAFALGTVMYFGLGVGMLNSYIKRFGWAILAVFFIMLAITEFYIDVTAGFFLLVFVFVFLGLFIWGNRTND